MAEQREVPNLPNPFSDEMRFRHISRSQNLSAVDHHDDDHNASAEDAGALTKLNVFCWVVNKMIGSGIIMTPPLVFALVPDLPTAISVWFIGFVCTAVRFVSPVNELVPSPDTSL